MFGIGKKGAVKEFVNDSSVAIVHIYADKVTIDGKSVDEFESMKGRDGEIIVKLSGGPHKILGTHRTTASIGLKTRNIKTKPTESEVNIENGHEYTFGIYEYSKAYVDANKDDPKFQYVYYLPMEVSGKEFGIFCFIDK